ncbi:MAG TPA: universal stress protein [Ramlibacter sp.]|nr:universal stress protein [Ramlibacter sp.]
MLKILVAVDGSDLSLDAVRHALDLRAQGLQASLVLANVQEPPSLYEMLTVRDAERIAGIGAGAGEHLLEAARQLCDASGADYEFEVASGDPAHTLVDMAERYGCSSIVAGARGKGGTTGSWLGSVSHELMHVSPVPVTVVKHPDGEEASRFVPQAAAAEDSELQPVVGLA